MKKAGLSFWLWCLIVLPAAQTLAGTTWYVNWTTGSNAFDGVSAVVTNGHGPLKNISAAITTASNGDTINVAAGFYQEISWSPGAGSINVQSQGQVTVYDANPETHDSDGDEMPDAWEVKHGLNAFDPDDASDDPDHDLLSNLQEFQARTDPRNADTDGDGVADGQDPNPLNPDLDPPVVAATIAPAPNANGWNNTNVVVHFEASDAGSGIMFTTSDVAILGETNAAEVVGIAFDNAGNSSTNTVSINIDTTPPVLTLNPGNGDTVDNSYPILFIDYADPVSVTSTSAVPSGLNLDSLQVTLDGDDVTNLFYRFENGALATMTNLTAGSHTWVASIADWADNVTLVSNTFTATGAVNTNAPVMSDLDISDDITVVPDVPEVWVQGKVTGDGSTVIAMVNGGEPITMNRRDDDFGYLLPLEPGTNVIVLIAADAAGQPEGGQAMMAEGPMGPAGPDQIPTRPNASSKQRLVVRTDKLRAAVTSPAFGEFANGRELPVVGYVSAKYDEGGPDECAVASVTVNGIAATLGATDGNGNRSVTSNGPITSTNTCSVLPIIYTICLVNGNCYALPVGLIEGYEVLTKQQASDLEYIGYTTDPCYTFEAVKWPSLVSFTNPCDAGLGNVTMTVAGGQYYHWGQAVCKIEDVTNWLTGPGYVVFTNHYVNVLQPDRSLTVGCFTNQYAWSVDGVTYHQDSRNTTTAGALGSRAPLWYPPDQWVVFTVEGMGYDVGESQQCDPSELTNVILNLNGTSYTPLSVNGRNVSYWVPMPGGSSIDLSESAFTWPVVTNITVESESATNTFIGHQLSFTSFHNDPPKIYRDGENVTYQRSRVLVGQRLNLWFDVPSEAGAVTSYEWGVPGITVANWVYSGSGNCTTFGAKFELSATNEQAVSFAWVDGPATREVRCTAKLANGGSISASTTFDVIRPNVNVTATQTGGVAFDRDYGGGTLSLCLHFGLGQGTAGVTFGISGVPETGDIMWVQTGSSWRKRFHDGTWQHKSTAGLDTYIPYLRSDRTGCADSPSEPLSPGYEKVGASDAYTMWLVFRPKYGPDPIWVPLRKVDWCWSGAGEIDATGGHLRAHNARVGGAVSTCTFPEWNSNLSLGCYDWQNGEGP